MTQSAEFLVPSKVTAAVVVPIASSLSLPLIFVRVRSLLVVHNALVFDVTDEEEDDEA